MRIAVLSDLHIKVDARWEEGRRVHRWIVDELRALRPDVIAIGGDLHDARTLPEERNEAAELLIPCAEIAEVVGVYGNHDVWGDLDLYSRLRGLHPITFYGSFAVHPFAGRDGAAAVVPWFREAPPPDVLRLQGDARREAEAAAMRARLQALGAGLQTGRRGGPGILLGHVSLREARLGVGQPEPRGRDFELGLDDLGHVGADCYALGHVHRSQEWMIGQSPVFYPGSTTRRTYGEIERKYIALCHLERAPGAPGWAASIEYVETPATPMQLVETAWERRDDGSFAFTVDLDAVLRDAAGADLRFRYRVAETERAAAAAACQALLAQARAVGAKLATPDEVLLPVVRARTPEIATATRIEDKLAIALGDKGIEEPQRARVLALFREKLPGAREREACRGPSTLHRIALQGIGPFAEEVVLDLDAIGGDLVCIAGLEGSGKTTLLEAYAAAVHPRRKAPTRGSLDALAEMHGRDAYADVTFGTGIGTGRVRVRHDVGRGEAWIWEDGEPVATDGKVSGFATWAQDHLLPPEVMQAALFLGQRSEGLVDADGAARREALLRAIGVQAIEQLAEQARRGAAAAQRRLDEVNHDLEREEAALGRLGDTAAALAEATRGLQEAETARDAAEAAVRQVRLESAAFDAREAERRIALAARASVEQRVRAHRETVVRHETRRASWLQIVREADAIKAAAARVRAIALDRAPRVEAEREQRSAALRAEAAAAEAEGAAQEQRQRWSAANQRRQRAEVTLRERERVERAVASIPELQKQAIEARAMAEQRAAEARAARDAAVATAAGRITALRGGLDAVVAATKIAAARAAARGAIDRDDAARGADPSRIEAIEAAAEEAARAATGAEQRLREAETTASRAPVIAAAVTEAEEAATEMEAASRAGNEAKARAQAQRAESASAARAQGLLGAEIAELDAESRALAAQAAEEGEIATVEQRIAEADAAIGPVRAAIEEAERELAALASIPDRLERPDAAGPDLALRHAGQDVAAATARLEVARRAEADAALVAARISVGRSQRDPLAIEVSDWNVLAEALGITGVQALAIDAASPVLTANLNGFLLRSYGSRFTGEVQASRPSRNKAKQKAGERIDEAQFLIRDSVSGRVGDVATYSGGERVRIATAIFLAVAQYVCQSRGLRKPTLILDEPGGGLNEASVGPWLDMVRDAARIIDADKVIVISHHPRVIDAADAVIRVCDSKLHVER